jgi:hypothetical protein
VAGRYKVIPQPVRFSAFHGPTVHQPASLSGQDNMEVLAEVDGGLEEGDRNGEDHQ